jgi:DNA-binding NarL/FixJ family response regulator
MVVCRHSTGSPVLLPDTTDATQEWDKRITTKPQTCMVYAVPGCATRENAMAVRILLVDDHPIVRQGLRTLLEGRPGWEIVGEASDGVEALDKVDSLQPDVVVLDVTMPRMNGLEACRLIQQKKQEASGMEVLFVTQHDSPQMMREALDAGARGYVVKSNAARDLLEAVEAVSQHRIFTALARSPQASC